MKPARYLSFSRRRTRKVPREQVERELVAKAFDAEYYLANNPDVAASGADPLRHFLGHGWKEGRNPAPSFSLQDYLQMYPDVASSGTNPFIHYLRHGRDEGRLGRKLSDPTPETPELRDLVARHFDTEHYVARNRDVAATGADPLDHFLRAGWREQRNPTADFSLSDYTANVPVVERTGLNPFAHHLLFGDIQESDTPAIESPSPDAQKAIAREHFNAAFYRTRYPDIWGSGEDPLDHFMRRGWREGRDPTPDFSVAVHLARHPQLRSGGLNPFVHHLMAEAAKAEAGEKAKQLAKMDGKQLRKLIAGEFDETYYRAHTPGLGRSGDALKHYLRRGWRDGRSPAPWFSVTGYLEANSDVAQAGLEPFSHFIAVGRAEGRRAPRTPEGDLQAMQEGREAIADSFDAEFYRGINRDVGPEVDPVAHYLQYGWQEGRDPVPWFSTNGYLELNSDVAEAGLNPFVHYITAGREEGRTIRRPFQRWQATSARPDGLPPLPTYTGAPTLLSPAIITRRIIETVGVEASLLVSVSETDPADATGSAGIALRAEAATALERRQPYLNVHPEVPRIGFAARGDDPILRLILGGTLIGSCKTSSLVEALKALRYSMLADVVIHGLAGHHPERLSSYVGLSGGKRMLWVHDYWLACPCRRLLNPNGRMSNPVNGEPPHRCRFDKGRPEHARRASAFLSETKFAVLAPSLAAKRNAKRVPVADPQLIRVAPQLTLGPVAEDAARAAGSGPIRVAFAADPLDDCAWPLFQELARRHAFDGNHTFLTFAPRAELPHFITAVPVEGAPSPEALTTAMVAAEVDVVLVAPGWPVPVSRAAHCALAAGCAIVGIDGSGNAADMAARAAHHLLLPTDEAIIEAFASGAVDDLVAQHRAAPGGPLRWSRARLHSPPPRRACVSRGGLRSATASGGLRREPRCIGADALHHGVQPVGALRRQMLRQLEARQEGLHVERGHLVRGTPLVIGDQDGDEPAHDHGIAVALQVQLAVVEARPQPHL